jgi:hypothetical protein
MRPSRFRSIKKSLPIFLFAALTAACSATLPSTQITSASTAPPADYRKIISVGVPATITKGAQISELQRTTAAQAGDWFACLKSDNKPTDGLFAVFIENGKLVDFRRSVKIDRCESATYSPLAPPAPPAIQKKSPPKRKQA